MPCNGVRDRCRRELVFRIRGQFVQHFDDVAQIIERRHRSGQLLDGGR
jgi:hypothetical protein